jgi:hypothetical protein
MSEHTDLQKDLLALTADLKRLEAEYTMFFAGRLPRPPWETRGRVEAMFKRLDRGRIPGTADRFRFETLQSRFQAMVEVWDRGLRAREEGRPGPFAAQASRTRPGKGEQDGSRIVHVTALRDPTHEMDKVQALYTSLMEARRQAGEGSVPFHRFAALVADQVTKLRQAGTGEVAFRVAVKDGKVNLSVRSLKGKP